MQSITNESKVWRKIYLFFGGTLEKTQECLRELRATGTGSQVSNARAFKGFLSHFLHRLKIPKFQIIFIHSTCQVESKRWMQTSVCWLPYSAASATKKKTTQYEISFQPDVYTNTWSAWEMKHEKTTCEDGFQGNGIGSVVGCGLSFRHSFCAFSLTHSESWFLSPQFWSASIDFGVRSRFKLQTSNHKLRNQL